MDLLQLLNIETQKVSQEKVILTINIEAKHQQPFGLMHGGISAVLAETAASLGANAYLDTNIEVAVGVNIETHHLHATTHGLLTAQGVPIHIGNRTQVWEVRIFDAEQKAISFSTCTLMTQKLSTKKSRTEFNK